jgi:hypothetical protein
MAAQSIPEHFRVAVRLARRDTSAMAEYANTPEAALFSFAAAFITLPMFFITVALGAEGVTNLPALIADLGPYTVGWLLFPVVMAKIVTVIDRERFYCRYVVAVNWCAVFEYLVLTVLVAVRGQAIIPEAVGNLIFVGLIVWVLMYQHFVARAALEVDGTIAALLVALRMLLDLLIVGLSKVLGG